MAHATPATPRTLVQNILFATDFSLISQRALPYAYAIAKCFGSTLYFVHVVGTKRIVGPLGAPYDEADREEQLAQRRLAELTEASPLNHLRHYAVACRGEAPDIISRLASEWAIDLIVVGTHGRHGFKQLMLGSVAELVFRRATCPVLTVGPAVAKEGPTSVGFSKIIVATDLSSTSADLLNYAAALARVNSSTLVLLHAITEEELEYQYASNLHDALIGSDAQLSTLLPETAGVAHERIVRRSPPGELIVASATEAKADLIVMGAHRGATVAAHLPQAIAHIVVCGAPCPVITVGH